MRDAGMNPRLLLVEDDPVSQAFLAAAACALPADVVCASDIAGALDAASRSHFDAWLLDAHLPDGLGVDLLRQLRECASSPHPFALGHTASRDPSALEALRGAGFDAAVAKPLSVQDWQAALRAGLDGCAAIDWDDAAALRALNGHPESMQALRALFLQELPRQVAAIHAALDRHDPAVARDELHRLKASCGFVGAARLRKAVDALHAGPDDPSARRAFESAIAGLDKARA